MRRKKLKARFWSKPKTLYKPWRRSFDSIESGVFSLSICVFHSPLQFYLLKPKLSSIKLFIIIILAISTQKLHHFGKFDDYFENKHLDWKTKRAALDASPFVVALISYTGIIVIIIVIVIIMQTNDFFFVLIRHSFPSDCCWISGSQRLFICSGTIISSYAADGGFLGTILTSASLLRSPTIQDSVADDIKVENSISFLLILLVFFFVLNVYLLLEVINFN